MKINIIAIGKLSREYRALAAHYLTMIKWRLREVELTPPKKMPENQIKLYEAKLVEQHLGAGSYKIVLDMRGKQLTSEELSTTCQQQMMAGRDVDIIIGGAFGLNDSIVKSADLILSLSRMTLPHQLARVMMLEQIYRAETILAGHPYHK